MGTLVLEPCVLFRLRLGKLQTFRRWVDSKKDMDMPTKQGREGNSGKILKTNEKEKSSPWYPELAWYYQLGLVRALTVRPWCSSVGHKQFPEHQHQTPPLWPGWIKTKTGLLHNTAWIPMRYMNTVQPCFLKHPSNCLTQVPILYSALTLSFWDTLWFSMVCILIHCNKQETQPIQPQVYSCGLSGVHLTLIFPRKSSWQDLWNAFQGLKYYRHDKNSETYASSLNLSAHLRTPVHAVLYSTSSPGCLISTSQIFMHRCISRYFKTQSLIL